MMYPFTLEDGRQILINTDHVLALIDYGQGVDKTGVVMMRDVATLGASFDVKGDYVSCCRELAEGMMQAGKNTHSP